MVTECSMADNVAAELPDVEFVRPCNLCPHMKRITLPKILRQPASTCARKSRSTRLIAGARAVAVERMINLKTESPSSRRAVDEQRRSLGRTRRHQPVISPP